jgi:hypothetical protein
MSRTDDSAAALAGARGAGEHTTDKFRPNDTSLFAAHQSPNVDDRFRVLLNKPFSKTVLFARRKALKQAERDVASHRLWGIDAFIELPAGRRLGRGKSQKNSDDNTRSASTIAGRCTL